jgi:hypothetical protein
MWLLQTKRVLKKECYRWSALVHIAATIASVSAMTYCQGPCDLVWLRQPVSLAASTFTANTLSRAQTCADMVLVATPLQPQQ